MGFLAGYLARHPARLARQWRLVPALFRYALGGRDRGLLKSRAIRAVMAGDSRTRVEGWAERFVADLKPRGAFRLAGLAALEAQFRGADPPVPEFWGGYRLVPERFEFWQGRENRLHDRFLYTRQVDANWRIDRLSP